MAWHSIRKQSSTWLFAAGIFGLLLAVYGLSLANDFVRWDDGLLIYENPAIREISFHSLKTIFTTFDPELYIPFTLLNYQFLYLIFGQSAWGYHVWSLLLHTSNALLVTWILWWLTEKKSIGMVAGLLFALHPLHVEAVAWASALKDQLSTLFYLLSIVAYLHYRDLNSKKAYWLSVIFMTVGLLSKVMVVTLPIALLLLDDLADRKWWTKKAALEKIPYFVLSTIFGLIAIFGKQALIATITPWQTVLMAFRSIVFYVQKLLWPFGLSVLYPYDKPVAITTPDIAVSVALVIALVIATLFLRKRSKVPSVCLLFFLLTLVPTFVNFSKGGNLYVASDRYAYLPSIGLFLLIAGYGVMFFEQSRTVVKKTMKAIAVLLLIFLALLSFMQTKVWAKSETLFRNVLKYYPSSYAAHNNIGNVLRRQGDNDGAITEFQQALATFDHPKVRSNLGAVYVKKGMFTEAAAQFDAAEKLDAKTAEPDFGRGLLFAAQGQPDKALAAYTRALEKDPGFAIALVNRGSLLLDLGRVPEARADFLKAIETEPYLAQAYFNLAILAQRENKIDAAILYYEQTVSLQPYFTQARFNLGALYAKVGKLKEAKQQFLAILDYNPGHAESRAALEKIETVERDY